MCLKAMILGLLFTTVLAKNYQILDNLEKKIDLWKQEIEERSNDGELDSKYSTGQCPSAVLINIIWGIIYVSETLLKFICEVVKKLLENTQNEKLKIMLGSLQCEKSLIQAILTLFSLILNHLSTSMGTNQL